MARLGALGRRWEGLLLVLLLAVMAINAALVPGFLGLENQSNLLELGVEKAIVALAMTFVIIGGEIDLSVASVMGLAAVVMAVLWEAGLPIEIAAVLAILTGMLCGLFNGFWVAIVGLPSLVVTLAGLIGFRGLAYLLIENRFISGLPTSFKGIAQHPFLGPAPLTLLLYGVLLVAATILLHRSGFGRYDFVTGYNRDVALYSGVRVTRVKMAILTLSGTIAALAGVLIAARFGAVRGSTAEGFELEVITIVLLGGVSIFGGSGTMIGVILSTLLVLNLRNGMDLATINGNIQVGVIGGLLILSVLVPSLLGRYREWASRRRLARAAHEAHHGPLAQPP